eukprot:XP_011617480.1 PREDICTED: uncharacterized protein LOC105418744 isoform X1 [Takifugu rubripes]
MHPALMFSVLPCQGAAPGRASSHWESRVLRGSIMAPVLGDPVTVRIDPVTLAALQDTGWYTVDLSRAQSLVWGSGEGRLFGSISTCRENSSFFCTGSGLGCHYLHFHKGACQTDPYLEGCRVYEPLKKRSECWKEENSQNSTGPNWSDELFGSDSRCFFSSLTRKVCVCVCVCVFTGLLLCRVTPKHSPSLTQRFLEFRFLSSSSSSRLKLFGSTALWKVSATDTGAPVRTGTKSRCLAPDGWTARLVGPSRWTVTMAPFSAPMEDCASAQPRPLPLKTLPHFPPPSQALPPTTEPDPIPPPPPPRSASPLLWSSWPPRPFPGSGSPAGSGSILPQGILPTCSKPEDNMLAN